MGGAPVVVTGPCGSPAPISPVSGVVNIQTPGCYSLQGAPADILIQTSNVTLLGNHLSCKTLTAGFGTNNYTGIVVQDLTVLDGGGDLTIQVAGTTTTAKTTTPAVTLRGITSNNVSTPSPSKITGSNVLIDGCTFNGTSGTPPTAHTDDPLLLYGSSDGLTPASWVTVNNCFFGPNFDVGFEGLGSWDHVTITNCTSTQGSFGGIGMWYMFVSDGACRAWFTNCVIQGNTLADFVFCSPQPSPGGAGGGSPTFAHTDAAANSLWGGSLGNVFSGNTYTALNRERCLAGVKAFREMRRANPKLPKAWQESFVCP
jgi:hypothetical protein